MTNRADELHHLADRVEAGEWETRDQLRALALGITNALYGKEAAQQVLIELIEDALKGSVDAARWFLPEGTCWSITYDPDDDIFIVSEADKQEGCNAVAHDEAHARLALALRVRAEMVEQ